MIKRMACTDYCRGRNITTSASCSNNTRQPSFNTRQNRMWQQYMHLTSKLDCRLPNWARYENILHLYGWSRGWHELTIMFIQHLYGWSWGWHAIIIVAADWCSLNLRGRPATQCGDGSILNTTSLHYVCYTQRNVWCRALNPWGMCTQRNVCFKCNKSVRYISPMHACMPTLPDKPILCALSHTTPMRVVSCRISKVCEKSMV